MPGVALSYDQFLDNVALSKVVEDTFTNFVTTLPMRFLDRLTMQPADDDEIVATYTSRPASADIVADDQAARVIGGGVMEFVINQVPNIKIGREVNQSMINRLDRLRQSAVTNADIRALEDWRVVTARRLGIDVRETCNYLACQMMLGNLTYSRGGVAITADWRVPADLKVTPTYPWTDATNGDPVTDVLTQRQYMANTYGVVCDRLTLPTPDFLNAVKCAKFQQLIPGLREVGFAAAAGTFNPRDPRMMMFFSELLQMTVELEDKQFAVENFDGTVTTTRVLPLGKVLMSRTGDDRNGAAWDFANAEVTEPKVAGMTGILGEFPAGPYGPLGYWAPKNAQLNPPGMVAFGVLRGFPRRFLRFNTATLTVR